MATTAVKTKPLDVTTFRAYKNGKSDDFPGTPAAFTRFCKALSRALAGLGATPPGFTYEKYASTSNGAPTAANDDERTVRVLLQGADPAHAARIHLEPNFVFALCDLVFGSSGTEPAYQEERPLSHIETDVANHFADMIAAQLTQAFQNARMEDFTRYKPSPDGLTEAPEFKPAMRVTLLASMLAFSGELVVELNAALAKFLAKPANALASEEEGESAYSTAIVSHVEKSDVEVKAILSTVDMTLAELSSLAPGQVIRLPTSVGKPVTVESDGINIRQARLGQQSRRFCLSIL